MLQLQEPVINNHHWRHYDVYVNNTELFSYYNSGKKIPTSVFVWRLFLMIEGALQIQDKEGKYGEQLKYMFFLLTSYEFGVFRAF